MYQKYEVLNELNGIKIRSETEKRHNDFRLDKEVRMCLLDSVFMKYKTVTHKRVIDALKQKYQSIAYDANGELRKVYGTQEENRFSTNLSSYIDMWQIFGDLNKIDKRMLKELIYWFIFFKYKKFLK